MVIPYTTDAALLVEYTAEINLHIPHRDDQLKCIICSIRKKLLPWKMHIICLDMFIYCPMVGQIVGS